MSFFYTTEPTFPTFPSSFTHPHPHQHHHRQPSSSPYYVAQPQPPQSFNPFELNTQPSSSPFPPHHHHPHPHHQHQPTCQPPQTYSIDPIEAHKQRLLAEFAQSLDQLYPSSTRQQQPVAALPPQPSYESERIRYLEAQLKEEQLRKELEVERIRLAEAKEVEEQARREAIVEKQRQEKLHHAYLVQQHRLQQQQQQQLAAEEEEQDRRRFLEHRQHQQRQQQQQQSSGLGGLEQLFALLSGSEVPRQEVAAAEQAPPQPQVQQKKTIAEHALGGLDQLLAFAQALENSPVPRAGEQQQEPEVASKKTPQQPTTSPRKPLPPSPLTTLRSLQTKLHSLLTSTASTATVLAHHLEKLLIDADELESGGDEIVRSERRKFVKEVERVLESLEEKKKKPVASKVEEEVVPAVEEPTISADMMNGSAPPPLPISTTTSSHASLLRSLSSQSDNESSASTSSRPPPLPPLTTSSTSSSSFLRAGPPPPLPGGEQLSPAGSNDGSIRQAGLGGAGGGLSSLGGLGIDMQNPSEVLESLLKSLAIENKIKDGAETMLGVLESDPNSSERSGLRKEVETELSAATKKISILLRQLDELKDHPDIPRALRKKIPQHLQHPLLNSSNSNSNLHSAFSQQAAPPSARRLPSSSSHVPTLGNPIHLTGRKGAELGPQEEDFQSALAAARVCLARLEELSSGDVVGEEKRREKALQEEGVRLVEVLRRNVRVRYELGGKEEVLSLAFAMLAEQEPKDVRAAGYRILRHQLVDSEGWRRLEELGVDYYVVRTFTRDAKHTLEKTQCLKLVRSLLSLSTVSPSASNGRGRIPLSDAIVRTLVSVAENADDPFRGICLETLAEIAILDVPLLLRSNALRVLLQCFAEGPHELAPVIAPVLLHVIDSPVTRAGLRPGMDIEMALSGFTDVYGSGEAYLTRLRTSSKVVSTMLKSWAGIIYLSSNGKQGILSLVNSLRVPTVQMREVLLDMFFDVFRIKTPSWYLAFLDGKRLTLYSKNGKSQQAPQSDLESGVNASDKLTLVDHFTAFLLTVFVDGGLVDALIDMVEEGHQLLARKATLLVGEILALASKLLPSAKAADIQSLPRLFSDAARFSQPAERSKASLALTSIDSLNRNRNRLQSSNETTTRETRKRANSVQDSYLRGQRQVESVKIRMGLQMEDKHFMTLLTDTQILLTRDHNKWNYDILLEVVQGPLLNPRRLEEALKASKFGRRLLSFFHPLNHRFSDIKKTKPNQRWVRLGCAVITTLLANPDGVAFLLADKLLPQLFECFAEIDHYDGSISSDPLLSKRRLDETLTSGYFEMLGTLSRHPEGVALLTRFKFFTRFYHLSDLRSREDLIKAIIENLDYTTDGHPRIVLSKALTSSYMHIRLYATQHLGQLVLSTTEANEWTLQLLITQLYDPSPEVCEMAVHFLEEACESSQALELVVQMRPFLEHLGDVGHPLLLRFLSTSVGFTYLCQVQYIEREMDFWLHDRNHLYVVQVELYLARVFYPASEDDADDLLIFDGTVPPHFYGELTKTDEGCQILREKGHFTEFAQFIRQHGLESEDVDLLNKLKSVLWAVGNIGSTRGGFPFLEDEDILENIVEIAEQSPILSIRGTCFFVLGLISTTRSGADFLHEYNWEATMGPSGEPTGLCIPSDLSKFVSIPPWSLPEIRRPASLDLVASSSVLEQSVMTAIAKLSNHVQANVSFRALAKLKRQHKRLFTSIPLFYRALHTLSSSHHRLPIRRFLFDLFDVRLSPATVSGLLDAARTLKAEPDEVVDDDASSRSSSSSSEPEDATRAPPPPPRMRILRRGSRQKVGSFDSADDDDDSSDESEQEAEVVPPLFKEPGRRVFGFDTGAIAV